MAVVDLEKVSADRWKKLLGSDGITKIRVVQMHQCPDAGTLAARLSGEEVPLNHIRHRFTTGGWQQFLRVRCTQMHRQFPEAIRDLFSLDQQVFLRHGEFREDFIKSLQADFLSCTFATRLDPFSRPGRGQTFEGRLSLINVDPTLFLQQSVVVREHQKLIAAVPIPLRNRLRKIVPVTPE